MKMLDRLKEQFSRFTLRNKLMFSMLVAVLFISVTIAFIARWILVSSLTDELEQRGTAIARSVADRGASFILDDNLPPLLSLIFNEISLHERRHLVSYIFIENREGTILAHTMTRKLPESIRVNHMPEGQSESTMLVMDGKNEVYDIAVAIKEGIYTIGTVHVGLSKEHIDSLISKLRVAFLGFISGVVVIALILSNQLTRRITRPVFDLTQLANEISRGNFDAALARMHGEDMAHCPAFTDTDLPCWHLDQSQHDPDAADEPHPSCSRCAFYRSTPGDEVMQLGNSFRSMIWSIRLYRHRLRESEEKYRSLFDSGPDPVFVLDLATQKVLDANPRAEELYGFAHGTMKGVAYETFGAEHAEFQDLFGDAGDTGCVYYPKEIHVKKNGEPFYVNMHACPIAYRGKPAIIVAATDITEIIEKDAQLVQASKMKTLGEMSAGVAHELNQPLNAIKMGTEFMLMAREGVDIGEAQRIELLEEISTQVDRASEIINTLRAFGRKSDMVTEQVDLGNAINSVLSILRRQFELDNLRFDLDLAPNLGKINAHSNRLQQVFFNLISNARDAINEHCPPTCPDSQRRIFLRTGNSRGLIWAEVGDTGGGMPEAVQNKVFEPFFTTKETGQGMGLGLAITYGIVKDYGGEITINSTMGQGTVFRLEFPVA